MRPLLVILTLLSSVCVAADLPDDAAKAIAAYEKKKCEYDAKAAADIAKEKEALAKNIQKVLEKETKAHHSDAVRKINDYLEDPENKSTTNLPEEATETLNAFDKKKHDIEAKAAADTGKQKDLLAKALQKAIDRETKANHADVAAAVKQYLDANGGAAATAAAPGAATHVAAAAPGKNPPWSEFLKSLKVVSMGGWDDTKGTTIVIGGYTRECGVGMNVVAMVEGKQVIEKTCHSDAEYDALYADFEKLPNGAYVVVTVRQDTGILQFSTKGSKVLRGCGAKQGLDGAVRATAYMLIGAKGMPSSQAIEKMEAGKIEYPFAASAKK
jgi:hypothetical protein